MWGAQAASLPVSAACRDMAIPALSRHYVSKMLPAGLLATTGWQPVLPRNYALPRVRRLYHRRLHCAVIFSLLKQHRRERLRRRPFPKAWLALIQRHVVFFRRLSASDRAELLGHVQIFLAETGSFIVASNCACKDGCQQGCWHLQAGSLCSPETTRYRGFAASTTGGYIAP